MRKSNPSSRELRLATKLLKDRFDTWIVEGVDMAGKSTFISGLPTLIGSCLNLSARRPGHLLVSNSDEKVRLPQDFKTAAAIRSAFSDPLRDTGQAKTDYLRLIAEHDDKAHQRALASLSTLQLTTNYDLERFRENKKTFEDHVALMFRSRSESRSLQSTVVFDRSIVGELVYGPLYREYVYDVVRAVNSHPNNQTQKNVLLVNMWSETTEDDGDTIDVSARNIEGSMFDIVCNNVFDHIGPYGFTVANICATYSQDDWKSFETIFCEIADQII